MRTICLALVGLLLAGCVGRPLPAGTVAVKATVADGPGLRVTATARNTGQTPVRYLRLNGCDKGFTVMMEQSKLTEDGPPQVCTQQVSAGVLQPGASVTAVYVYKGEVAPGSHKITVSFHRLADDVVASVSETLTLTR